MILAFTREKASGIVNPGVFLFWTVIMVSLTGCSVNHYYPGHSPDAGHPVSFYIQGVPFFPQEEFQCGPSVLASVLNFWGNRIVPEEISRAIYLTDIQGTLKMDMVSYARRYGEKGGMSVFETQGDIEGIKQDIAGGYPVITFVDLGVWGIRKGHYMLIVGYDDEWGGIIAYSGIERGKFISYDRFLRMWERGGYWTLSVVPN
ncbi:MAG: C39 family peptidase [Nitrospirae bacterium]|nr:C39 family peptidase [Nitrospirota bacterium]